MYKNKIRTAVIICILVMCYIKPVTGQPNKLQELKIQGVTNVSVDPLGEFYFVCSNNWIQKRDRNGKLLDKTQYHTEQLSLIESWNPLRVFIYSEKNQQYTLLGPHLNILYSKSLNLTFSSHPKLVCPSNNPNIIWVFDNTTSLKKINMTTNEVEVNASLPKKWINDESHITFIREYQNKVFLLDKLNGIFIFNNIGIPIKQIKVKNLSFFNFIGQELCYLKQGKLFLLDLYTGEKRILQNIDHIDKIKFTIVTDNTLVVVANDTIHFFEVKL